MATIFTSSEVGLMAEARAGSKLDYGIDWSDFLEMTDGDTIESAVWSVEEDGITLSDNDFTDSLASVWIEADLTARDWFTITCEITTSEGRKDSRVALLFVKPPAIVTSGGVFPNRIIAIAEIRRDRLMMAASGALPSVAVSDEYIWDKLMTAQANIARQLRVKLTATVMLPAGYTQAEVDALPEGTVWAEEPPYDYDPEFFMNERWGYIVTREAPVLSVDYIEFVYPAPTNSVYRIPNDWIRIDKAYGHIRLVPASQSFSMPLGAFLMQALGGGRTIPHMIRVRYTTGLGATAADVKAKWPDLVDVIKRQAVFSIVKDAFQPSSGSISADGLSQSMSIDLSKYQDAINETLFGPKGSNGGLQTAIHGIRNMVVL